LTTSGANGIPDDFPVRTAREDPDRRGLLYAGTEFGIFASFDDGATWQSLQLNLPVTPVTGMRVAHGDLIISTQGRSFWILDDRTPLFDVFDNTVSGPVHLFGTKNAYRANTGGGGPGLGGLAPEGHPGGALIRFYLAEDVGSPVTVEIQDFLGQHVRSFSSDSATAAAPGVGLIQADAGMNTFVWDLNYPGPALDSAAVVWGYVGGVKAPPGTYQVQLVAGEHTQVRDFQLLADPRIPEVTQADYDEQFRVAIEVRDSLTAVHNAIKGIRSAKQQILETVDRADQLGHGDEVTPVADSASSKLAAVEELLLQVNSESGQDPIRFPGMLDNQYAELYGNVTGTDGYISGGPEGRPTAGAMQRLQTLNGEWAQLRQRLQAVFDTEVAEFNALIERLGIPAVAVEARRPVT